MDVIGSLPGSDYSTYIAAQSYRDWGNEPCVAVNPLSPNQIVISSFGYGSWISRSTAQLWYSTNNGANWRVEFSVPTPYSGVTFFIDDQSYAYDSNGTLHGALLARDPSGIDYVWHGSTTNLTSALNWNWDNAALSSANADQPWVVTSGSTVAVAYDNFNSAYTFSEERVAISTDFGQTFPAGEDQAVASPGQANTGSVNPGLRIAADDLGDCFIICGVRTNNNGSGIPLINYRLNRYSGAASWDFTSATSDAIGGLAVTNGPSRQGNNSAFSFGYINYLLGNITAIAVNTNGSRVYIVYGLSDASQIGHLFLQRLDANGANLVQNGAPLLLSSSAYSAALPSIAVARNGAVGVLYDEFDGLNFNVHLALSRDEGLSLAANNQLYSFNTNGMAFGYGTTPANHNRLLGDYDRMIAFSNTFYATFAGRGNTAGTTINTTNLIVPFFYSFDTTPAVPAIVAVTRPSAGALRMDFTGSPGVIYFVQATTNVTAAASWRTISTNIASASGAWSYTDPTINFNHRFYRAMLQ